MTKPIEATPLFSGPTVAPPPHDIIAMNLAGVESHFHAEDTGSVSAALEAFTDDCVWEAPNPIGLNKRLVGKEQLGPFYQKLFTTKGIGVIPSRSGSGARVERRSRCEA